MNNNFNLKNCDGEPCASYQILSHKRLEKDMGKFNAYNKEHSAIVIYPKEDRMVIDIVNKKGLSNLLFHIMNNYKPSEEPNYQVDANQCMVKNNMTYEGFGDVKGGKKLRKLCFYDNNNNNKKGGFNFTFLVFDISIMNTICNILNVLKYKDESKEFCRDINRLVMMERLFDGLYIKDIKEREEMEKAVNKCGLAVREQNPTEEIPREKTLSKKEKEKLKKQKAKEANKLRQQEKKDKAKLAEQQAKQFEKQQKERNKKRIETERKKKLALLKK
jgi:hypothetical protein